ncbi:hypothetical protein CAEBREN_28923 [Caenorhabditis brenneri]|uniref:Uncharacterized protein n=1 Tax=Caenorhabditis brenneri TaxID=135651 RepID=G0N5F6_CAEBE|nr:hypothetical protein CAEBREN_28923 [Caenorhabditis brenneri]
MGETFFAKRRRKNIEGPWTEKQNQMVMETRRIFGEWGETKKGEKSEYTHGGHGLLKQKSPEERNVKNRERLQWGIRYEKKKRKAFSLTSPHSEHYLFGSGAKSMGRRKEKKTKRGEAVLCCGCGAKKKLGDGESTNRCTFEKCEKVNEVSEQNKIIGVVKLKEKTCQENIAAIIQFSQISLESSVNNFVFKILLAIKSKALNTYCTHDIRCSYIRVETQISTGSPN